MEATSETQLVIQKGIFYQWRAIKPDLFYARKIFFVIAALCKG